jgi:SAM-dependent methyltransferase
VTAHLTHEVAAVPFLWILPLALYLLTFILCFDAEGWYKRKWYMFGLFPAIAIMALFYEMGSFSRSFVFTATTYSLAFFGVCMFCHGELARSKPHPRYLTLFYLMVSVGGAVGGLFVGLVAPFVFPDYYELPMLLFVAAMVAFFALTSDPRSDYFRKWEHPLMLSFLVVIVMLGSWNIARMALTGYEKRVVIRNFYGVVKVRDQHIHSKEKHVRSLYNGSILHGEQWQGKEKRSKPRSFYCEETGLAKTITYAKKQKRAIKVGVLGLGTGTVAAFARSLDTYRFYDINPAVIQVAKTQFTYLKDAKSRGATVQTVVGDARLSLEREPKHGFDVLVVDCFSSDAIPVHLLTKEAFQLYVSHLAKGGVLLLHISNQFLTLDPVVERITRSLKLHTLLIESYDANDGICFGTSWVVIAPDKKTFDDGAFYKAGKPLKAKAGTRLWTDNYSSLFDVLGR